MLSSGIWQILSSSCADSDSTFYQTSLVDFTMQVVSSAIVDKYIGESARLIREMFSYARDHQPCIIFMDEIDAIGQKMSAMSTLSLIHI